MIQNNIKTFTETREEKTFDWNSALSKDCKEINLKESCKLESLAKSWVTCACGNQCYIIPRYNDGRPKDEKLSILGESFHHHAIYPMHRELESSLICDGIEKEECIKDANKYRLKAIEILKEIEGISLEIITEMK